MSAPIGDIVFGYNLHSPDFISCKKFEDENALIDQLEQASPISVIRGSGPSSHISIFGVLAEECVCLEDVVKISSGLNSDSMSVHLSKVMLEVAKLPRDFFELFQSEFFGKPDLMFMRRF